MRASWEALSGYEKTLFASEAKLDLGKCGYYWLEPRRVKTVYEFAETQEKKLIFKFGNLERQVELKYLVPKKIT